MEFVETIRLVISRLKARSLSFLREDSPNDTPTSRTALEEMITTLHLSFTGGEGQSDATVIRRGLLKFKHTPDRAWTER